MILALVTVIIPSISGSRLPNFRNLFDAVESLESHVLVVRHERVINVKLFTFIVPVSSFVDQYERDICVS